MPNQKKIIVTAFSLIALLIISGVAYFLYTKYLSSSTTFFNPLGALHTSTMNSQRSLTYCGWLPWWDYQNAVDEMVRHQQLYDYAHPFVYILTPEGSIASKLENFQEPIAQLQASGIKIIPTIYNQFDRTRVANMLATQETRQHHIRDLVDLVNQNQFDGIEIDYEYLEESDQEAFSEFIQELATQLHASDRLLAIDVHAKTDSKGVWHGAAALDYPSIGESADLVKIMAYDYHWADSEAGPLAPLPWVRQVTEYSSETIPSTKLILGIGTYGYEWTDAQPPAQVRTLTEISRIIETNEGKLSYNELDQSPSYIYEQNRQSHHIWFENLTSLSAKLEIASNYYSGVCFWRLGGNPDQIYQVIQDSTN